MAKPRKQSNFMVMLMYWVLFIGVATAQYAMPDKGWWDARGLAEAGRYEGNTLPVVYGHKRRRLNEDTLIHDGKRC